MAKEFEYLITSNRQQFQEKQGYLQQKNITHRIRIRSFPPKTANSHAMLYTIYVKF